jgi:hypothetical protein
MLVNTRSDKVFQRYLDERERDLYDGIVPVLIASVRLQAARNHIQGQDYLRIRGVPILVRHYRQVYGDQFRALNALESRSKAAGDRRSTPTFLERRMDYLKANAGRKIADVSRHQARAIGDIVTNMTAEGRSPTQIARDIAEQAPEISRARASAIARTETHNSAIAALIDGLQYKRVPAQTKTWATAHDSKVRPSHQAVGGTTLAFDEPFDVGGAEMMYPGDDSRGAGAEEIVNCRCSLLIDAEDLPDAEAT